MAPVLLLESVIEELLMDPTHIKVPIWEMIFFMLSHLKQGTGLHLPLLCSLRMKCNDKKAHQDVFKHMLHAYCMFNA